MPRGRRAALRAMALCWAAGLPTLASAQAVCPPDSAPPVVPAGLLSPNTKWSTLATFMNQENIRFVATSGAQTVIPCRTTKGGYCAPMVAQVLSEQRAFCLTQAMAGDSNLRFSGAVVRMSGGDSSQVHLGFGGQNATDSVYLMVQQNQSVAVFHGKNDKVNVIPQAVLLHLGWRFVFHPDSVFTSPQAQWRPSGTQVAMTGRVRPPVRGGGPTDLLAEADEGEVVQGTSYAWMACAAGCCQFHGLPAGSGDDDEDEDEDEDGPPRPRPHPRPRMQVQKDGGAHPVP